MRARFLMLLLFPFFLPAQTGSRPAATESQPQAETQAQQLPQTNEQQETTEEMRAELEEGIKHMLVSQIEAWNHGKLESFMQGYWHSPDLTFFSGASVTKGWEPTLLRYRERYQSEHKEMGKLEFQDLAIELLSRKAAVVTGRWQLTMPDGKQPHGTF